MIGRFVWGRSTHDLEARVAALELQLADQRTATTLAIAGLGAAVGQAHADRVEAAAYALGTMVVPGAPDGKRLEWIQAEAASILKTTADAIRAHAANGVRPSRDGRH